ESAAGRRQRPLHRAGATSRFRRQGDAVFDSGESMKKPKFLGPGQERVIASQAEVDDTFAMNVGENADGKVFHSSFHDMASALFKAGAKAVKWACGADGVHSFAAVAAPEPESPKADKPVAAE